MHTVYVVRNITSTAHNLPVIIGAEALSLSLVPVPDSYTFRSSFHMHPVWCDTLELGIVSLDGQTIVWWSFYICWWKKDVVSFIHNYCICCIIHSLILILILMVNNLKLVLAIIDLMLKQYLILGKEEGSWYQERECKSCSLFPRS